jgi:hypothetical protein
MDEKKNDTLLSPFFFNEGGYCHLLHVLLTADNPVARDFRRSFSEKILAPKLQLLLGEDPVNIRSEVTVSPPGGRSQSIDLVVDLDNDVIGIELKVFAASARKGQLAAQYLGLSHETPNGKRVHIMLIFPSPTCIQNEVKLTSKDDRAVSIAWKEVFDCFPTVPSVEPDKVLGFLFEQSMKAFGLISGRAPKTPMTPERFAVQQEMKKAITHLNDLFGLNQTMAGCTWKPHFWRDPRMDQYYGPITGPDGTPRKGQYLSLSAHYDQPSKEAQGGTIRVKISFVVEWKGGAKIYFSEFKERLQSLINSLPQTPCPPARDRDDTVVFHEILIVVNRNVVETVGNQPSYVTFANLLNTYASVFSDFLLRNVKD